MTLLDHNQQEIGRRVEAFVSRRRVDLLIMVLLMLGMGLFVAHLQAQIDPIAYDESTADMWFDSDIFRVFNNLTDRNSSHYRTNVHPLFSIFAYPLVQFIQLFVRDSVTAVQTFTTMAAAGWMGLLYVLLRLVTGRRLDAVLFSLVAAVSAASLFWLSVPETYVFSSASLIVGLIFALLIERRRFQNNIAKAEWPAVIVSLITLSMLLTNWMAGLIVTAVHFPRKRAIQITLNVLAIFLILWGAQKLIFPTAGFFLELIEEETGYIGNERSGGPLKVAGSFFLHTMSMPQPEELPRHQVQPPYPELLLTQGAGIGSGSIWGAVSVMLWVGLLGFGVYGLVLTKKFPRFRLILLLILAGQLGLCLVYGTETFLYSLNILPLLIVLAAMGSFVKERIVVLVLAGLLVVTAAFNNYAQFRQAAAFYDDPIIVTEAVGGGLLFHGEENPSGRERVLMAMSQRPNDPWPRGTGHVILALPGTAEIDKGYYEPGGSFSPAVGSFGISIWVLDSEGRLITTSDDILMPTINQQFVWSDDRPDLPGIQTNTPYYQALWQPLATGNWELELEAADDFEGQLALVVRSVGPAGGPVTQVDWINDSLHINGTWEIVPEGETAVQETAVQIGNETQANWIETGQDGGSWESLNGWGYARMVLAGDSRQTFTISRFTTITASNTAVLQTSQLLNLNLPDERFIHSLDAQAAHLEMSLVGNETRPGDPLNYPLTWQRDAAYIIVALARAGHTERAEVLAGYLAENDFFGGFGAEADAPGLGIWSLNELAVTLDDPAFGERMWPHIVRKAELIEQMMRLEENFYHDFSGPVVPFLVGSPEASLVAGPVDNGLGLINGRMDHHRPLLYVNAVSYRGLLDAADFARRLGHREEAERWQTAADALQQGWNRGLQTPEANNERTYISGLWPTWIAQGSVTADFENNLDQRWDNARRPDGGFVNRPLWTYFEIGEAHQWLYLEQPERVWETLDWFWDNQTAPGLYTWWEGSGEENSFHQWEKVRGWVEPPYVSPHYWTTAEMLLLQLDMLAYSQPDGTLVIGGGVPESWLDSDLHVGPLPTPGGSVEWEWNGTELTVTLNGDLVTIAPGPAFANKPLNIQS